jgi:hypothetical protein
MINFLKDERGAWLRKRWKFVLVCSSLVIFFLFSCVEQIVGKKLTANLVIYNTMEVHSADTLPWLEVGL